MLLVSALYLLFTIRKWRIFDKTYKTSFGLNDKKQTRVTPKAVMFFKDFQL